MNNDQLHEDAVKLLLQRQGNATETTAKGVVKSYNQRRRQATAKLRPKLIEIRECFRRGESVGGFTSWTDWAASQSVTIKQLQRIISGAPQKRHDVVLKVGMTVIVGGQLSCTGIKVVLTQAMLDLLVPTPKKVAKAEPVKSVAKRTKKLPETAHFRIESNGRKGGAQGYNVVCKEDDAIVWRGEARGFGSYGTSNLDYANIALNDQEEDYLIQQEGAAEDIEIGHTCDHGEYYHNAEGDFQEADPHSINPACDKCTQAAAV